jgi:hypothetical protein
MVRSVWEGMLKDCVEGDGKGFLLGVCRSQFSDGKGCVGAMSGRRWEGASGRGRQGASIGGDGKECAERDGKNWNGF